MRNCAGAPLSPRGAARDRRIPSFLSVSFNHALNRPPGGAGARVVGTERSKDHVVTLHVVRGRTTIRSIGFVTDAGTLRRTHSTGRSIIIGTENAPAQPGSNLPDRPRHGKDRLARKRRGFVFQSSEIYGGLNGCWDYGPLGVELLRNIKEQWWQSMTYREDVEGLDAAILMHPTVWEASGHVANFTDPMVDCKECKARFRADQIEDAMCGSPAYKGRKASKCQAEGKFTEARQFNLMFKTFVGPVEDSVAVGLSPSGNGAGDLRQFPERAVRLAPEDPRSGSRRSARRSATRSTRRTSCSARASSNRWRCSSS